MTSLIQFGKEGIKPNSPKVWTCKTFFLWFQILYYYYKFLFFIFEVTWLSWSILSRTLGLITCNKYYSTCFGEDCPSICREFFERMISNCFFGECFFEYFKVRIFLAKNCLEPASSKNFLGILLLKKKNQNYSFMYCFCINVFSNLFFKRTLLKSINEHN